jgi:hypothetical protein
MDSEKIDERTTKMKIIIEINDNENKKPACRH